MEGEEEEEAAEVAGGVVVAVVVVLVLVAPRLRLVCRPTQWARSIVTRRSNVSRNCVCVMFPPRYSVHSSAASCTPSSVTSAWCT